MGDLGAIHEDVRFNWAAAADLAAELRACAAVLDEQVPQRQQDSEGWLERNLLDPIFGEDDLPPPPPAVQAPRIAVAGPPAASRD